MFLIFQCLGQAWYLDCDMQMFLIILLVIYPMWKWGKSPPYAGIIEAGKKHALFRWFLLRR